MTPNTPLQTHTTLDDETLEKLAIHVEAVPGFEDIRSVSADVDSVAGECCE